MPTRVPLLDPATPIVGGRGETASDLWRWAMSDLVSNANRGVVAEYIVGLALGVVTQPRVEWDHVDLEYGRAKIEVKSAGLGQTWDDPGQPVKPRRPVFDIARTRAWVATTNTSHSDLDRSADCYVFCVHTPERPAAEDVLDLSTWDFYVWLTVDIDEGVGTQKSIALSRVRELARPSGFAELKSTIDEELARFTQPESAVAQQSLPIAAPRPRKGAAEAGETEEVEELPAPMLLLQTLGNLGTRTVLKRKAYAEAGLSVRAGNAALSSLEAAQLVVVRVGRVELTESGFENASRLQS